MKYLSLLFLLFSLIVSCSSGAKRLNEKKDLVADSGSLTRLEMEEAAVKLASSISKHFKKNKPAAGVFVELLRTKNETTEEIPTDIFDNALVNTLLAKGIYTVRSENLKEALEKLKQDQELGGNLSAGELKSPNYFIKTQIDESVFRQDGDKIVEQVINVELRSVETTLVAWSDKVAFRKKARSNSGVGW
ncbi:MAG: penicillin-binding protein activator LpoB [Leptospiraceae bacterium]|nr:penicillin-binding protein activator LpoB [Leptospiraceae bacterium]MCP5499444.1 penicillin-binding protein activator LpoB [Leptospiraceae bacterium]